METKICSGKKSCKEEKLLTEFTIINAKHKLKSGEIIIMTRRHNLCKKCRSKLKYEYRQTEAGKKSNRKSNKLQYFYNKERCLNRSKKSNKKQTDALSDRYVRNILIYNHFISKESITPELINLKREQLTLYRNGTTTRTTD